MEGWWNCLRRKPRIVINEEEELSDSTKSDTEVKRPPKRAKPAKSKHKRAIPRRTRLFGSLNFKGLLPNRIFSFFGHGESKMTKLEKTLKASLLIQKWFRSYMARLEVRRIYTWSIFQTLEYAGEQDQVKLYNFFNALLTHIPHTVHKDYESRETSRCSSIENLDFEFEDESPDEDFLNNEEKKYLKDFTIEYPFNETNITELIEIFRKHRHFKLPPKNVADILKRAIGVLKRLPNINVASTALCKQITICGDLHGKFDDLLVILHKNGLPSAENPYVFNGDFVDRGKRGLEVILILLLCLIAFPGGVYLNRGNHEDHIMNQRYGFKREMQSKYKKNADKLMKLIEGVYRWLPLGTIVNNKVLVVHGGISDTTDLELIRSLEREKYVSLLEPPLMSDCPVPGSEAINKMEWKQVFDILWSDPQESGGCIPNSLRGAGTYFGPDVTKKFLAENRFSFLVRSHECKPEGYEVCHDNLVITIFSASNYYEVGSNNGAYLKLMGLELTPHYVQYMANAGKKKLNFFQRMGSVESGAARELQAQIINNRRKLEMEFADLDPENIGYISITQWCTALENATGLQIPWRMLKEKLVKIDPETNQVKYHTTFDIETEGLNSVQGGSTVVETLYRNKSSLETIFRLIDKDNSGYISLDELRDACNLIKAHMPCPMTEEQLTEICRMMDINKDGLVDLNEFLETFRMVDPESRRSNQAHSPELNNQKKENPVNAGVLQEPATGSCSTDQRYATSVKLETDKNGRLNEESIEEVQIHNPPETDDDYYIIEDDDYDDDDNEDVDTDDEDYDVYENTLHTSPVLSSRRGSQI